MPAYNFMAQFAPAVRAGRKLHTVRKRRHYPTKPGQTFTATIGARSPKREVIFIGTVTKVEPLLIRDGAWTVGAWRWTPEQVAAFVAADTDGRWTVEQFEAFIRETYGDCDDMEIVHWEEKRP